MNQGPRGACLMEKKPRVENLVTLFKNIDTCTWVEGDQADTLSHVQVVRSDCLRSAVHSQEEHPAPRPQDPEHFSHFAEHY
jgi:hypothetical protein